MQRIGRSAKAGERELRIGFVDFHKTFNPVFNHLTLALREDFPLVVVEITKGEIPDYLFFSVFGPDGVLFSDHTNAVHLSERYAECIKIFVCEENIRPPWHECDYAITSDRLREPDCRHLRLPIYARHLKHCEDHTGKTLIKPANSDLRVVLARKTRFCNFVYSNAKAKERILFFEMLSKYKRVDSGGSLMNNMGGIRVSDKTRFLEDYKFTIAFENSRQLGYVSEKLVEPMVAGSLPVYWGCREVVEDFNPFSFVCANEPEGSGNVELALHFEQVIRKVIWLDTHDDDYVAMMSEPWFHDNVPNDYCKPRYTHEFMRRIFTTPKACLSSRPKPPAEQPISIAKRSWADEIASIAASSLSKSPPSPTPSQQRGGSWADHLLSSRSPDVKK
jgi:hypothetical protein